MWKSRRVGEGGEFIEGRQRNSAAARKEDHEDIFEPVIMMMHPVCTRLCTADSAAPPPRRWLHGWIARHGNSSRDYTYSSRSAD